MFRHSRDKSKFAVFTVLWHKSDGVTTVMKVRKYALLYNSRMEEIKVWQMKKNQNKKWVLRL